jgi:thiamine-phosphate pyrophosphorylase
MSLMNKKGLYAITPNLADTALLLSKVEQALQGGIALLQYRDKTSSSEVRLQRALALHAMSSKHNVPLIINDGPQLALACNAEGVHIGQSDGSVQQARLLLGKDAIIGVTCHHDVSLAITAEEQGADYVAFGRFFHSSTKPGAPLATLETLAQAKNSVQVPIVAIGGINLNNAAPLIENGADYIAVIEGLFSQHKIQQTCKNFNASKILNTQLI